MPLEPTMDNCPIGFTTPLGKDKLLVTSVNGTEGLNRLFRFELELISTDSAISAADILGQNVTIRVNMENGTRYFNGHVVEFSRIPSLPDEDYTGYRAVVVPWLWFLTRRSNCRIFQDQSAKDVIKAIFADYDCQVHDDGYLHADYQPREYCVQYRETDFNFVSRLMEQEGICYYFKHEDGKHTLVLADTNSAHDDLPDYDKVQYNPAVDPAEFEVITRWVVENEVQPGKYTLWDHEFRLPDNNLEAVKSASRSNSNASYEMYDYPGQYVQFKEDSDTQKIFNLNTAYATHRLNEFQTDFEIVRCDGSVRGIMPGYVFQVEGRLPDDQTGRKYLITSAAYKMANPDFDSDVEDVDEPFLCSFAAIPTDQEYAPARVTPKPVVQGPQTALVTGPSGEEIYVDKYGRIIVQFFWDRKGQKDASSSCWVRCAHMWAGKQWGTIFTPRIGMEVVVTFLEGDPDKPLVTGCVYNADMMPPYTLPDNKTQSGILTRSTLQGTEDNFNQLRFEDKKDSEEIYFHAEKDFNRVVENNDTLKVGFDKKDKGDQTVEIFNNQSITVGADQCDDGSRTKSVWNKEDVTIGAGKGSAADGSQTVSVWNDQTITVGSGKGQNSSGSQTIEIWKDRTVTIDTGNDTLEVKQGNRVVNVDTGNDTLDVKMGNREVKVDMGNDTLTVSMGNITIKAALGAISIEGMQSIELKVGQSSVKIDPMGVTIQGMMVKVQGQVQTQIQGLMCQVSGDAMLQAKGGITMIG